MAEELSGGEGADSSQKETDLGRFRQFPAESRELAGKEDARKSRRRYRWLFVCAFLGAVFGLTVAIPDAPGWIRLPGTIVGHVIGCIPGMPGWVLDWICPVIGWAIVGALIGWMFDEFARQREERRRRFYD
jgi:hypothetical protein